MGSTIGMFSAPIGIRDSNEAEFMAITYALEMSLQKAWILEKDLIVESDSRNALSWVNNIETCPWNLRFFANKVKNMLVLLNSVSFVHRCREANDVADSLAKEGAQREGLWSIWT